MVVSSHEKRDYSSGSLSVSRCTRPLSWESKKGPRRDRNTRVIRQLRRRCRRTDFHNAPCTLPHSRSLTPSHPPAASCSTNARRTREESCSSAAISPGDLCKRERTTGDHRETFRDRPTPRAARLVAPTLPAPRAANRLRKHTSFYLYALLLFIFQR